jgi:ATP-dependent helicase/nuclease subunit B
MLPLHRQKQDPETLRTLWRNPVLLQALSPEDPLQVLRAWECYAAEAFPDSDRAVDQTLKPGELRDAWEQMKIWIRRDSPGGWLQTLRELTEGQTLDPQLPEDRFRLRQVQKTAEVLQEAVRREEEGQGPGPAVLLQTLERETVDPLRVEGTFTAEGWLELPYHPAERLLLIGLQEGLVPPPPPRDPILPLQLREDLGLKSDRDWLARDTYLFHTMLRSRTPGSVRVWVMKRGRDGSPLMPSRLLFACDDGTFLDRASLLFGEPAPEPPVPAPAPESWFKPDRAPHRELERLSVSKINAYLTCPTRFYFQVVLGMDTCDDLATEPDAAAFGTLIHRVLEEVVKAGPCDLEEWHQRCDAASSAALRDLVGPSDRMSLRVFEHSARKRLQAAGRLQVDLWQEGWTPVAFESTFTRDCQGVEIVGKVDRIDRHPEKGLRILDYKTSDSPVDPQKAHTGTPRPGRESIQFELDGRTRQWTNLQLPLYRWLVSPEFPEEEIEVAYFQLPSAVSDTGISSWEQEPGLAPQAEACLEQIVQMIQSQVWHPTTSTSSPWDPYAPLLLEDSGWVPSRT